MTRWTREEAKIVRETAANGQALHVAAGRLPGRTVQAVKDYAKRKGIKFQHTGNPYCSRNGMLRRQFDVEEFDQ